MVQSLLVQIPEIDVQDTISSDTLFRQVLSDIRNEYLSDAQEFPWIVGFSGGKDSTLVAHAVFSALLDISPSRLTRPVHIIANDTLVESPLVAAHLHQSLQEIRHAAEMLALPITVTATKPNSDNTFWVLLIGKGYPSPNSTMRWCTDRLKIQPTSRYILDQVAACGSAIILLGVRKDESATRRRSVEAYPNDADSRLHPHKDLKGAFIYRPIVDLATDNVWERLSSIKRLIAQDSRQKVMDTSLKPPFIGLHQPKGMSAWRSVWNFRARTMVRYG